jgi:hypothetical protein
MVTRTVTLTVGVTVNEPPGRPTNPIPVNGFEPSLCPLTDTPGPYRFRFVSLTGTNRIQGTLLGSPYLPYPLLNNGYEPIRYRYKGPASSPCDLTNKIDRLQTVTGKHL